MKNKVALKILAGALALGAIVPSAMAISNQAHPAQPNAISAHTFTKKVNASAKVSSKARPVQPRTIGPRPFTR